MKSLSHIMSTHFSCRLTISVLCLALWNILPVLQIALAEAAPSPVECSNSMNGYGCEVSNTYGAWPDRSICKVRKVVYPSSEQELVAAVADAVKNQMKIKVVSKRSNSIPKLVCPGGDEGLLISTRDYASATIAVNSSSFTARVESGVELRQFVDAVAKFGMALPHSPYWDGVSIGGLLSTGSHGSSLWGKGSAVHEYVVGMRLVIPASAEEGYAKTIELTEGDEDLNAAKVSLGVLGVISQVTFSLQPLFKRSVTNNFVSDDALEDSILSFADQNEFGDVTWHPSMDSILSFADQNEFGDVTWHPSMGKAIYRMDNRVDINAIGKGVNNYIGFQPTLTAVTVAIRSTEELSEKIMKTDLKCVAAKTQVAAMLALGTGLKSNRVIFTGYPVIGLQNLMQTSGSCQNAMSNIIPVPLMACPWDPRVKGLFYFETAVIAASNVTSFIRDVKLLRNATDYSSFCGVDLYDGILMRFVKNSTAYLGKSQDVVDINFTYYRSRDPSTPRLNEDVLEEMEQMALMKYKGTPHWGKNRNVGFEDIASKYPDLAKFVEVKRRFDPQGLFSSEWTDTVLGIAGASAGAGGAGAGVSVRKEDKCALEGLCICSEDRHCAPDRGYVCRPGKVFVDARVCRYQS